MQQQLQRAFQLLQQGQHPQAEQIGRSILSQFPNQPDALNLMGLIEKERGSLEQARLFFNKGLEIAPGHLHLMNSAGLVERELKNFTRSEAHFKNALTINPGYFYARQNLASLYQEQRRYAQAKQQYLELIKQLPEFADALANLSNILEIEHQLDDARSYAERALKINPGHYIALLTLANIAARDRSFDEVISLLLPLLQSQKLSAINRAVILGKCAFAYEKLGDYKSAFSCYRDANQVLYDFYKPSIGNLDLFYAPAAIKKVADRIPHFRFSRSGETVKSPVFMIGFPRSGTTLLDQILSSHSHITVLEEKPNLLEAYTQYPATEEGLGALENAGEAELDRLRQSYWERVNREIDPQSSTPVIVDKLPLNAVALLHISRLFPDAKIITALREPRDSVFSCYQQRFGMNLAMFQMLKLETAASYYDQVMSVVTAVDEASFFPMHFIRYENVIGNFKEEVKAMIDFLGLEWEDALLDYQTTARSRDITTPSASQVIQPLYSSSIGKWRHYRHWIGEAFDPLEKWVDKWGYRKK